MSSKEEVEGILLRIERLKSLIQMALEMDHLPVTHLSRGCIVRLITFSATLSSYQGRHQKHKSRSPSDSTWSRSDSESLDHQRHHLIAGWISTTDSPPQQSDFIARREDGTGQWFLESSIFTTWLQEPKSSLFCPGIPRAGKTILAAITIDHLSKKGT